MISFAGCVPLFDRMPRTSTVQNPELAQDPQFRSVARSADRGAVDWMAWLLPGFALCCWALAIRHLSPEWAVNEQYHFGWLVPVLTAYLVKVRLEWYPAPNPPRTTWFSNTALAALAVASILIMPVREANLDWRLVEWWLVGVAIASTLVCFWQAGGWKWVLHFSFPVLFFLIAVPLPRNLEYPWMDKLMLNNARLSVEFLHWVGVEAAARGNLIQLPAGTLGVDEACSGIRSLQSTLMLSLFLGEILALSWARRAILLGAGLGWALVTNVGRTTLLGLVADRDGIAAVDQWHDMAGFSVLALCAVTVALTAWLLRPTSPARQEAKLSHEEISFRSLEARLRPVALVGGICIGSLAVGLGLNKLWFDSHERSLTEVTSWELRLPTAQPQFQDVPIPPQTRKLLNFDDGYGGSWQDAAGSKYQAYYFRWEAGRNAGQTARPHDPRACLGAMGMELSEVLPSVTFAKGDLMLSFDAFHFVDRGRDLFVFNCLTEDVRTSDGPRALLETNSPSLRIAAAIAGRRQMGQRRVEVAMWDVRDAASATEKFRALLNGHIQFDRQPERL